MPSDWLLVTFKDISIDRREFRIRFYEEPSITHWMKIYNIIKSDKIKIKLRLFISLEFCGNICTKYIEECIK